MESFEGSPQDFDQVFVREMKAAMARNITGQLYW